MAGTGGCGHGLRLERKAEHGASPTLESGCDLRADHRDEPVYEVGHDLVDGFLEFVAAKARPNTVQAYAHDLKVFFDVVNKEPADVGPADVLAFVSAPRRSRPGAENVVRISDGSGGLSEATIKRRLAAVSSLYGYLVTVGGVIEVNPVPRGLPTRRAPRVPARPDRPCWREN